jgi:hypothetical protein
MPFEVSKITNVVLCQNISEIFFIVLCGISTISDNSIYQWITFPSTCGLQLLIMLKYNYYVRKYYKDVNQIKKIKIILIIGLCLITGLGIWYNVFMIRNNNFSAQTIALHNFTIFLGWFIFVVGIGVLNKMLFTRQAIDYYTSSRNSIEMNNIAPSTVQ